VDESVTVWADDISYLQPDTVLACTVGHWNYSPLAGHSQSCESVGTDHQLTDEVAGGRCKGD